MLASTAILCLLARQATASSARQAAHFWAPFKVERAPQRVTPNKAASHKGLHTDLHEDATPAFVNQCVHLSDLAIMGDSPDALIMAPSLLCTSLVTSMTRLNRLASRSLRHSNTCLNLFQSTGPQHAQINMDSGSITLGPTCLRSTPGILCTKFWRGVQAALQLILDFLKAFDIVLQNEIWAVFCKIGIDCCFLSCSQTMYGEVFLCNIDVECGNDS